MTINSKVKSIIVLAVFATFIVPKNTLADEYKWLKASNYENIFVYTNFEQCTIAENQLTETIKGVLLRSRIQPSISKILTYQLTDENGKPRNEFLVHELTKNKKVFLYVVGGCHEQDSGYLYKFGINFAIIEEEYLHTLLHESPDYGVMGTNDIDGINKILRTQIENAVADYLSANMQKAN